MRARGLPIARVEPGQVNVMPDGIYGSQTAAAVRSFQRRMGQNPTGIADKATHEAIVREFERSRIDTDPAQPVQVTLEPGQVLRRGEGHPAVYLVQSMLTVLHDLMPTSPPRPTAVSLIPKPLTLWQPSRPTPVCRPRESWINAPGRIWRSTLPWLQTGWKTVALYEKTENFL